VAVDSTAVTRRLLVDILGFGVVFLLLLDFLRPDKLFSPTIMAGGDLPCHYPTAVFFHDYLLPRLRLHGWYAGAYLGQPLLLYYFPLPFLLISALAPLAGMPVAFKLGVAGGVVLLPPLAYASLRLMGFRFPTPVLGAAAALVFLFVEDNPIWGGTLASTLSGEFSYSYGIALAVLFLGVAYRSYTRGRGPWTAAAALAVTAFAHGYAVLWAGLSALYFLYAARRAERTLAWLAAVAGLAFAFAAVWLVPLLADWRWTTPYRDAWISVAPANLFPRLLWPLFAAAGLGLLRTLALWRPAGGPDHRLLFLWHSALVGVALALAGPALGVIDVRFVPFAQLALCLAGAAALGTALERVPLREVAAAALVGLAALHARSHSQVLRSWIAYDFSGLQAKEQWPAFQQLADALRGSVADPRVAVEYSAQHEKAGSIRVYETLPFFSGRSTLEGVYNQASLQSHFVYYVASELGAASPNPFKSREYSGFDPDGALAHLRLFNVRDVVALSPLLESTLRSREGVTASARIPPYSVFRLDGEGGYVEPLAFAPVRSSPRGWRDKAYRWFTRRPMSRAPLVFTDDPRFEVAQPDEWLPPPETALPSGVEVRSRLDAESLEIHTSRVGHPLLVKVSYHPRWRADGADGPYLVSPALMLIVPRQNDVRLRYSRTAADAIGLALTGAAVLLAGGRRLIRRRPAAVAAPVIPADACEAAAAPRRWGALIPVPLLVALAGSRLLATPRLAVPADVQLRERAAAAYAGGRYAEAAAYADEGLHHRPDAARRDELVCLRAAAQAGGQPIADSRCNSSLSLTR
jgi:6-pyruvoyl-tetrahydropterin synthase related domain